MPQVYLAINYGAYEGWRLEPYDSPADALKAAQDGDTHGSEWIILREIICHFKEEPEK